MKAKQFYVIMAVVMALSLVAVALPAVPVGCQWTRDTLGGRVP